MDEAIKISHVSEHLFVILREREREKERERERGEEPMGKTWVFISN